MRIIWAEIKKEFTLLLRDKAGFALLFIMPAILVVVMTYIQDAAFRVISNDKVEVLWVDQDQSKISQNIAKKLESSGYFKLVSKSKEQPILEENAKNLLADGKYQVGIILPKNFQRNFKSRIKQRVDSLLTDFGLGDTSPAINGVQTIQVKLFFDPLTKATFKTSVSNGIMGLVNEMETQISFMAFKSKLASRFPYNPSSSESKTLAPIVTFKDEFVFKGGEGSLPTSVQHNVPAWTVFAIFFIIVAFSQRIVEERKSGVNKRILTLPVNPSKLLLGKAITYVLISEIQMIIILGLGFWLMPLIGLPTLVINGSLTSLLIYTIPVSLASGGLALLIGSWSKTRDQAASFGSVAVIIFAALGGVWVPVFAMPGLLQSVAKLSPLNWALDGYYSIILRGAGLSEILLPSILLIILFGVTFGLSSFKKHKL
ncbi:MAG: ABC transporter permease [Salibacteraceae bacterium]